jgi:hypothetical protein
VFLWSSVVFLCSLRYADLIASRMSLVVFLFPVFLVVLLRFQRHSSLTTEKQRNTEANNRAQISRQSPDEFSVQSLTVEIRPDLCVTNGQPLRSPRGFYQAAVSFWSVASRAAMMAGRHCCAKAVV